MRICVLGTGYVGLVAGACFSDSGNHVTCADVNVEKVSRLRNGKIPIYEPGLEEIISRSTKAGRLTFSTDISDAVSQSEIVFIAVGTPQAADGSSDLSYVLAAADSVATHARQDLLLVLKSTVPVGTAAMVRSRLQGCHFKIEVVSNPEFLKEGTAIGDFLKPERVIIGTSSENARRTMGDLYAPYVRSGNPILFMSNTSAELTKYAANTFLAMKISFINELALLADKVGADIQEVRRGIITDSRIGHQFLYPGCGYGGSCFPKDVLSLVHVGQQNGLPLTMFSAVHEVNERQKLLLFAKMTQHFGPGIKGKTVAIWGLSFKPQTDDMREAPSVTLIQQLLKNGCKVKAYDPVAREEAKRLFENSIEFFEDAYEATREADALAVVTEWNEFRNPDFLTLKKNLRTPVIFDGRNLYNPTSLKDRGFSYYCIGRPDVIVSPVA